MKTPMKWIPDSWREPGAWLWALVFGAGVLITWARLGRAAAVCLVVGFAFSYIMGVWEEGATNETG